MRTFAIGISTVLCLVGGVVASRQITHHKTDAKTSIAPVSSISSRPQSDKGAIIHQFAKTPMAFEVNQGQANSDAKFLARGAGYEIFLTPRESVFVLQAPAPLQPKSDKQHPFPASSRASVLHMELVGANSAKMSAEEQLPGKSNYLIGKDSKNWHTDIPNYRRVREQAAYPGIDLVYYGTQKQLEYDFVVAPKTDASTIRFAMKGAEKLRTDAAGDLVVSVAGGELSFHKPFAYQQNSAQKVEVAANYALGADNTVSFQLGNYDHSRELVIDPILSYSTYLGGTNIDAANGIAVASDNTAFIAGGTFSTDFPTAGTHPLQPNHGGADDFYKDAFVAKLSADGTTVLYATYLGGAANDTANGIAVDNFGQAYVTGATDSIDFPVTAGNFGPNCGSDAKCGASYNPQGLIVTNGFLTKLNTSGSLPIYSEYIGYYEDVSCSAVAVDADENAYITGQTSANGTPTVTITPPATPPPPFPITGNAFQPTFGGGVTDAFIMKVSPSGLTYEYSSYFGGGAEDDAYGIAVDTTHNAYITGVTYSPNIPLVNALQAANAGAGDAFVAKINTDTAGGALIFATYLGGGGLDQGNGIAVDSLGNVYVTGATNSSGLATGGVLQATNNGQGDAFVAKYTTSQATPALGYFTYIGGSKADTGAGIAVDSAFDAYVAGSTVSTDFPMSADAFQNTYGGGNADAFVAKLDPAGATLLYSSYLGGTNTESGNGIAIDHDSPVGIYVAGETCSADFPLSNPAQPSYGGNCDAFVSKIGALEGIAISPSGLVFASQTLNTTSAPQTITVTSGADAVTLAPITITGDFAIAQNSCGSSLAANSQCAVSVTFTPTGSGDRTGALTLSATVAGQRPQSVVASLSGSASTVPDFSVTTTSLTTATVSAGQTATFALNINSLNGYTQPVSLACSGLPSGASCAITPNPVTPTDGAAVPVTVTISTAVRTLVPPAFRVNTNRPLNPKYPLVIVTMLATLLLIAVARKKQFVPRPALAAFSLAGLLLLIAAGCGGGNATNTPAGTQAGTYTVTVVATSGSITHDTTLTLTVK